MPQKKRYQRMPSDEVLEHFEALNTKRMGVPFRFERFTTDWQVEKSLANSLIKKCDGSWFVACRVLDVLFTHGDFSWKSRPSLKACMREVVAARAVIAQEAKKRKEQAPVVEREELFG